MSFQNMVILNEESIQQFEDENTVLKDEKMQPYMFEPNKEDLCESSSISTDGSSISDDDLIDPQFEPLYRWKLATLKWCKCGKCAIMERSIESFCCHEKALDFDEYNALLTNAQMEGSIVGFN